MGRFLTGSEGSVYDHRAALHFVSVKPATSSHLAMTTCFFQPAAAATLFQDRPGNVNANPIAPNTMTTAAIGIHVGDLVGDLLELSVSRLTSGRHFQG
jgi:hypothetical protein